MEELGNHTLEIGEITTHGAPLPWALLRLTAKFGDQTTAEREMANRPSVFHDNTCTYAEVTVN